MPTLKPLREMLPELLTHIRNHVDFMSYNNRLFLVHEGQLRKEIEDSLRKELSPKAYAKAITRVPSINLLIRIIDKLSRVYSEPVSRTASVSLDTPLMQMYERDAAVNKVMASANKMFNLQKCAALEPFVQGGKPHVRVLPAHQFLVYSDDRVNPLRPTVFIKFMGQDRCIPFTDLDGRKIEHDEVRLVQTYYIYSDDEFLICDSEGRVRGDRMAERMLDGTNPIGRIPFVYLNRSEFRLIPLPDTDTLDNTVLIPKLLADLNYAVQFQSHSIFVATDLDVPSDLEASPDVVWNLKSSDEGGKQGRVDTVKPSVDIEQVILLIKVTLAMWLESRNIKAGDLGQIAPGDAASGVARVIDESDATQDRQSQCGWFMQAEHDLWQLLRDMHNYWVDLGELTAAKFDPKFTVMARFGDQKPMTTDRERIEAIGLKMDKGLMGVSQAIQELYPHWTESEVETYLVALEADKARFKEAFDGSEPSGTATEDPGQHQKPFGA